MKTYVVLCFVVNMVCCATYAQQTCHVPTTHTCTFEKQVNAASESGSSSLKQIYMDEEDRTYIHESIVEKLNEEYAFYHFKKSTFAIESTISDDRGRITEKKLVSANCMGNLHNVKEKWHHISGDTCNHKLTEILLDTLLEQLLGVAPRVYDNRYWAKKQLPLGARCATLVQSNIIRKNPGVAYCEYYRGWEQDYFLRFLTDSQAESKLHVIEFTPRTGMETSYVLTGNIYYDEKCYDIMKFEGEIRNVPWKRQSGLIKISPKVSIGYTHKRGFTEVEYVTVRIDEGDLHIHAAAYNIGKKKPTDLSSWESHTHLADMQEELTPVVQ